MAATKMNRHLVGILQCVAFTIVLFIILSAATGYGPLGKAIYNRQFSVAEWNNPTNRDDQIWMVDDLVIRYKLIGKDISALNPLIGPPEDRIIAPTAKGVNYHYHLRSCTLQFNTTADGIIYDYYVLLD